MVDVKELEVHQKMVSLFGSDVLEDSVLQSVQVLQEQLARLLVERAEITQLVHQALVVVVEAHDANRQLTSLCVARDALIQVKLLTGT